MAAADYDFNVTRNDIIHSALRIVGKIGVNGTVSGNQLTAAAEALNEIVKEWQNDHIFLWTKSAQSQALSAATASYVLPTNPAVLHIEKAFYRENNSDTELPVISWENYQAIPDKTSSGTPSVVAINNALTPTMYVWPVPAATANYIYYLAVVKLEDFDAATDNPDLYSRYIKALKYALAADLADDYGIPLDERSWLTRKAEDLFFKLKKSDRDRESLTTVASAFPSSRR